MTHYKKVAKMCIKIALASVLIAIVMLSLAFCTFKTPFDVESKKQDFFALSLDELEKLITIGEYKKMNISPGDKAKDEAIWDAIVDGSAVHKLPEAHIYYYVDQFKGQYRYYAEKAGMSYDELLEALGESEASILDRSKTMTKKDILFAIVAKKENIVVTDDEKGKYFGKYADKYVSEYGYDIAYVTENMADEIYNSMLYDKVAEFLILNNNILQ